MNAMANRRDPLLVAASVILGLILTLGIVAKRISKVPPNPKPTVARDSLGEPRLRSRGRLNIPPPLAPSWSYLIPAKTLADASVDERAAVNDQLLDQRAVHLFNLWRAEADRKKDPLLLDFISNALSFRVRDDDPDNADVYQQMAQFIGDTGQEFYFRWHLVDTLGETATKEALALLLDFAKSSEDSALRQAAYYQITRIAGNTWDQRFHDELSPFLENAWRQEEASSGLLPALGLGLAKVGAASGIDLLLQEIVTAGQTIPEFEARNAEKAWVAFESLEHVRNPNVRQVLEARLNMSSPESIVTAAVGFALSTMGDSEATGVLLRWVQNSSANVSPFVHDWFVRTRDTGSIDLISKEIELGLFHNPQNKEALRKTLSEWKAHRAW